MFRPARDLSNFEPHINNRALLKEAGNSVNLMTDRLNRFSPFRGFVHRRFGGDPSACRAQLVKPATTRRIFRSYADPRRTGSQYLGLRTLTASSQHSVISHALFLAFCVSSLLVFANAIRLEALNTDFGCRFLVARLLVTDLKWASQFRFGRSCMAGGLESPFNDTAD
jgi:hypothetical protein